MNFELRPLGGLCDRIVRSIDPKCRPDESFRYIDISAVNNSRKRIVSPQKVQGKDASVRARQVIQSNDVLVSTTRPNLNAVALVPNEYDGQVCSTGFCVLRCGPELDPHYLFAFVQSGAFIGPLSDLVKGALYPAVTDKQVFAQMIPWVPLGEQRRIAARLKAQLAAVEEARRAAQAQLNEIKTLKTTALDSLFNQVGPSRLIGEVARVQSGYAFKSTDFQKVGVRLLRNANILPLRVYWDDAVFLAPDDAKNYPNYVLSEGDVVISLDRPIISSGIKVACIGKQDLPALLLQRVGRFQPDARHLDADYLFAFIQTNRFMDEISGHEQSLGVPHISPGQVEDISIPLPSLEQQVHLASKAREIMKAIDNARVAADARLAELDRLPARLLAQAFDSDQFEECLDMAPSHVQS